MHHHLNLKRAKRHEKVSHYELFVPVESWNDTETNLSTFSHEKSSFLSMIKFFHFSKSLFWLVFVELLLLNYLISFSYLSNSRLLFFKNQNWSRKRSFMYCTITVNLKHYWLFNWYAFINSIIIHMVLFPSLFSLSIFVNIPDASIMKLVKIANKNNKKERKS